jgi:hypothetical protein
MASLPVNQAGRRPGFAGRLLWLSLAALAALTLWPRWGRLAASNAAGWFAVQGLLAGPLPDPPRVEAARQSLYQAVGASLPLPVFVERIESLETSTWQGLGQALSRQGDSLAADQALSHAAWTQAQFRRLISEPRLIEHGRWLPAAQAAEQLQLWSLADFLYQRVALAETADPAVCLSGARVALELAAWPAAEQWARCALASDPRWPAANWRLVQALTQQDRWAEARAVLVELARAEPAVLHTAQAAAIVAEVEARLPSDQALSASPELRLAWQEQSANLIVNGDFEDGYLGWVLWPETGSHTLPDTTRAYSGLQSMHIEFDGSQDVNFFQFYQVLAVEPGQAYSLTAQIWAEDFTGEMGLEVRQDDMFVGIAALDPAAAGRWSPVALIFTAPQGVEHVGITVRRYSGQGLVSGHLWLDHLRLAPVNPAP